MRFDDEERIDALEGQMKAMQKALEDMATQIGKTQKDVTTDMDNRFKVQSGNFDQVDKRSAASEKSASDHEAELKKTQQRVAALEQQVKKLSK